MAMKYRLLGNSGLRVSELALGTMTFGEDWGWGASQSESAAQFEAFLAAGGNFIDTANRYTNGTSEKYVGELIAPHRDQIVLATKYSLNTRSGDPNGGGNHRKNLVQALDASLKRLGTHYIDLYWLHAWDFMTPIEEVMRALDDAVSAGKVLYVGVSDTPAWIVSRANMLAELRGWSPFVALQIEYSLIQRTPERDLIPMARALGLAVTPWAALGGGVLTGKYNQTNGTNGTNEVTGRVGANEPRRNPRNMTIAAEVMRVAEQVGRPAAQVALNWIRQQPGVNIPIVGARSAKQLTDSLGSVDFELSAEQIARLDAVSQIDMGFPHDFLASDSIRNTVFGGTYAQIDTRR